MNQTHHPDPLVETLRARADRGYVLLDGGRESWSPDAKDAKDAADRIESLTRQVSAIKVVVDAQAEDEGLWFIAATAPEAYLQQELRRLHAVVEGNPQ